MRYIDVFNGDADGLCALHQLRLAEPLPSDAPAVLITGLKRDIGLLERVAVDPVTAGDNVITVLDVSLNRNRAALERLLAAGAIVRYFDHHFAGVVPTHPGLQAVLDPSADVCTGMLVDRYLGGRYRVWAVVAAFGDNLIAAAQALAAPLALDAARSRTLRELGEAINYNGYGDFETDVMIHPRELYRVLHCFVDPFAFYATSTVQALIERRRSDLAAALTVAPTFADAHCAVYPLPVAAWSGRVIGTFANTLAQNHPSRAHAVLKENADGTFTVSVRAPLQAPHGADTLCRQFETGGGRAAAAGIDRLPASRLEDFKTALRGWSST
ncbi:MAG: acetyltransferase [Burkholderiaceae bacterium]